MRKPSIMLIAGLGFALGCGWDEVPGPASPLPQQRIFTRLQVTLGDDELLPRGTSQLMIKAWDQAGALLEEAADGEWSRKASYSSNDPLVAVVSSTGLVTAVGPGRADITASLTLGGVTRTASVPALIAPAAFSSGVYDLEAQVTSFDPAWGDLTGYRYRAVLTIPQSTRGGTFELLRLFNSTGTPESGVIGGIIQTHTDFSGRRISELISDNFHLVLSPSQPGSGDSRVLTGDWGCCAHISGNFVATLRL